MFYKKKKNFHIFTSAVTIVAFFSPISVQRDHCVRSVNYYYLSFRERNLNTGVEKRFDGEPGAGSIAQLAALPKSDEPLKGNRFLANPIVGVSEK